METVASTYTCNSCQIQFSFPEDQRSHMKGEWHRYNLKRRVAQLPPLSEDMFNTKVATVIEKKQQDDGSEEEVERLGRGVQNVELTPKQLRRKQREELLEKKRKLLELAKNRLVSNGGRVKMGEDGKLVVEKKEATKEEEQLKEEVAEAVRKEKDSVVDEETLIKEKLANKVDVPVTKCIFCKDEEFEDVDGTFGHLFKQHGLYVPERTYLINKEGLLSYLYEKIGYGNVCLSCNFQGRNFQSIIQHMLSKNHIKIPYETEDEKLEISDFYDFSKTYEVDAAAAAGEAGDNDEEWEDVDDEELENDEDIDGEQLYASDYGLHLPNGVVLGHRALAKYYRQNLKPEKELTEAEGTVMAAETRNFVKTIDSKAIAAQKRVWSREAKSKDRDDRRAQKFINWQPHYRDQLLQ